LIESSLLAFESPIEADLPPDDLACRVKRGCCAQAGRSTPLVRRDAAFTVLNP
jgi:hypothetical protein